ncbi:MAG: sulfur carrier protein ThiS adenylyltransferase ThiF [Spirochaetes bacterium]|nr:sulfur carrier protein ThiS adenylyltransferase ThiF [Spirochaetota bacterium]
MSSFTDALEICYGIEKLKAIQNAHVGIVGAGGLGSNAAACLVRSGFIHFTICDYDIVEASNLNRQFYFADQIGTPKVHALQANLFRINPLINVEAHMTRITETNTSTLYRKCDIVIEALDTAAGKRMLAETYARSDKLYVSASGLAGWGNADAIVTRWVHGQFALIGDGKTAVGSDQPPCAPRVMVAAAKEADVVLSWVLQ